jgi:hypothetical protein
MDYLATYNRLIEKARSENRKRSKVVYYEGHHIIPRCMGGKGKTKDINHPNIVLLTAKEHYIAHRLLCQIYPDNEKLRFALWCMINGLHNKSNRYQISARSFEQMRITHAEFISNYLKGRPKNSFIKPIPAVINKTRYIMSDDHKDKIRASLKGRKESLDVRAKKLGRIPWNKGKKLNEDQYQSRLSKFRSTLESKGPRVISDEHKKKLSIALKGRPSKNKGRKFLIPRSEEYCQKLKDSWQRRRTSKSAVNVINTNNDMQNS